MGTLALLHQVSSWEKVESSGIKPDITRVKKNFLPSTTNIEVSKHFVFTSRGLGSFSQKLFTLYNSVASSTDTGWTPADNSRVKLQKTINFSTSKLKGKQNKQNWDYDP